MGRLPCRMIIFALSITWVDIYSTYSQGQIMPDSFIQGIRHKYMNISTNVSKLKPREPRVWVRDITQCVTAVSCSP